MLGAIVGDIEASIVAEQHVARVARVDPEGVMVRVHPRLRCAVDDERLPAVGRREQVRRQQPDTIGIVRVHPDLTVVARALIRRALPAPGAPAIGRSKHAAGAALDHGIHDIRLAGGDGDANATDLVRWEPVWCTQALPGVAAIERSPESAARSAAGKSERATPALI